MKINRFFAFQQTAINNLVVKAVKAHRAYAELHSPQVISFTAPTGAGKTIMAASFIEDLYNGTERSMAQPDAIFIWLSDSPELNQQSRDKIDMKADRIRLNQCITISEDSFDREILEDGKIYFLNTQKLSRSSNLTHHSDSRQFTIWETLANTVQEKSRQLYVIIDEAHRGAKTNQTGIMQKFIRGSVVDNLPPMPVVIGMSATSERFNKLIEHSTNSMLQPVVVTPDDVRNSGLLKDRIVISDPGTNSISEMAILEFAADEWKNKCEHWKLFCDRYHHEKVNPVFVVQVQSGTGDNISDTDIAVCLSRIEERTGYTLTTGEVVHTFGQTQGSLYIEGFEIPYMEPSRIADDKTVRIVLFKENLSTGWDCPRAETMISFRRAVDATYIAQLLGRMVRTPIQSRITSDDTLNDVHLYLPYFDAETVKDIVEALTSAEGGALPTDVISETLGNCALDILSSNSPLVRRVPVHHPSDGSEQLQFPFVYNYPDDDLFESENPNGKVQETGKTTVTVFVPDTDKPTKNGVTQQKAVQYEIEYDYEKIPRADVIKYINSLALTTYNIRNVQVNDYMKSVCSLTRFLNQTNLSTTSILNLREGYCNIIHKYAEDLRHCGRYEFMKSEVMTLRLHSQVFDVFGGTDFANDEFSEVTQSAANIEIQLRQADIQLGGIGIAQDYIRRYAEEIGRQNCKLDVILFALDDDQRQSLQQYSRKVFHSLNDQYRRSIVDLDDLEQKRYADIVKDGSAVSKINYILPETIGIRKTETSDVGIVYRDHLYVDEKTMTARINLNSWERDVIVEEEKKGDFVCWLRNRVRSTDALCLKYNYKGKDCAFYPDFIIVRKDAHSKYVVDILEPHNPSFDDNVAKAKALAEYAREYRTILGRVELIRKMGNTGEFRRLDMCRSAVNDAVMSIQTAGELDHLFETEDASTFVSAEFCSKFTEDSNPVSKVVNHYHVNKMQIKTLNGDVLHDGATKIVR